MKSVILTKVDTFTPSFKDFLGLKINKGDKFIIDFINSMYKDCKIIEKDYFLEVFTKKGLYFNFCQFGDKYIRKKNINTGRQTHYKIN